MGCYVRVAKELWWRVLRIMEWNIDYNLGDREDRGEYWYVNVHSPKFPPQWDGRELRASCDEGVFPPKVTWALREEVKP